MHYVTNPNFEATTPKGKGGDVFNRKYIDHWPGNVAKYPHHYVTNVSAKFEVASYNGLGGDFFFFTNKISI